MALRHIQTFEATFVRIRGTFIQTSRIGACGVHAEVFVKSIPYPKHDVAMSARDAGAASRWEKRLPPRSLSLGRRFINEFRLPLNACPADVAVASAARTRVLAGSLDRFWLSEVNSIYDRARDATSACRVLSRRTLNWRPRYRCKMRPEKTATRAHHVVARCVASSACRAPGRKGRGYRDFDAILTISRSRSK